MDERMNSYGGERRLPINGPINPQPYPLPRQQFYPQNQMQGYPQNAMQGYPQNLSYPQNPAQSNPQGVDIRTAQPSAKETVNGNAPRLAQGGFKPLSKEERAEAAKVTLE